MSEEAGSGVNRREFLRTCGRVAAVGAIAVVGGVLLSRHRAAARMSPQAGQSADGTACPDTAEKYPAGICVNDGICQVCPAASDCPLER